MAYKILILCCLTAVINAAPQHVAHSHAQITLNKASIHRDTLHETPVHHNIEHKYHSVYQASVPATQHYSQVQQQQSTSNEGHYNQQSHSQSSQTSQQSSPIHHISPVVHVAPVLQHVAPIAHFGSPVAQVSHSQSSSSQHNSLPAHYSTISKVALAAPVAHYSAQSENYNSAQSGKLAYAVPVTKYVSAPAYHHEEEEYGPAEYSFEYSVHDEHTGDIKSQKEERHGDKVQGSYMLIESDGSRRIVEYTADDHSGFNAVVRREEVNHSVHPIKAAVIAPVAVKYAAPAYAYHH